MISVNDVKPGDKVKLRPDFHHSMDPELYYSVLLVDNFSLLVAGSPKLFLHIDRMTMTFKDIMLRFLQDHPDYTFCWIHNPKNDVISVKQYRSVYVNYMEKYK